MVGGLSHEEGNTKYLLKKILLFFQYIEMQEKLQEFPDFITFPDSESYFHS